jgi:hypothetical protein
MVPDGSGVVVGRADADSFAVFPADGAELLRRLRSGVGVAEAGRWYRKRYGEPVDMDDFLDTLRELEFVRTPGEAATEGVQPGWQRMGRIAFSWPAWLGYLAVGGWALYLVIRVPHVRPSHDDFFFTPSLLVMELGLFFGQLPGILFHEAMHTLAGRRLGVRTRLRLGNRLHMLVFETHLNGLWSVPRRRRYLPLLAGMVGDVLWWSALTILAWLTGFGYLLALALSTLLRLVWQFYFYLRTDVYQVLVTALGCVDLHRTTKEYLANRLRRHARYDETRWHPRDRQVARWYAHFFVWGYVFTLGILAWIGVPFAVRVLTGIVERVRDGDAFSPRFLDGLVTFVLNFVPLVIVAVMVLRRRGKERNV